MVNDEGAEPERPALQVKKVALIAGGVFAVIVLISGIIWGPTAWRILQEKDPELSTPDTAAGLTLDTTPPGKATAADIQAALSAPVQFDKTIGGVYREPGSTTRSVIVMAGQAIFSDPAEPLDKLFAVITDTAGGVSAKRDVDPGPLGGEARCGVTQIDAAAVPVCGWADHGSAGLLLFPGHTPEEAPAKFAALRSAIQHR
ncbi:hypothetical protein [Longispora albida]|uniref:hypothetical protein n=1 Tax=Longispora albida TaxID=203523 RepID=UPI00036FCBF0|nr:hypothetical protein [Longispora albida]